MKDKKNKVNVCSKCLRACCYQEYLMCYESDGTSVKKTIKQLKKLNLEHHSYWEE